MPLSIYLNGSGEESLGNVVISRFMHNVKTRVAN